MNINRHNYEAFFLDHLEGRLSREQEKELKIFLASNPDLAAELDDFEAVHLDDKEKIIFSDKSGIKKKENELTPVTQLIALMEGDLTQREAAELKKKIQTDKYLQTQSELLSKTKLAPDTSIRFPNKSKLKRSGKVIYMWRYAVAVAAAAIIIIGLTFVFRNVPDKKQNETVVQKSTPALPKQALPEKDNVIKQETPLAVNKKPATQSAPEKKSIQKEKVSEQTDVIAPLASNEITLPENNVLPVQATTTKENIQPVFASENAFNTKDVFSDDEWKELHNMSQAEKSSPTWTERVTKEGMSRLEELTGVRVKKDKQHNGFTLTAGNFEVRHVSGK